MLSDTRSSSRSSSPPDDSELPHLLSRTQQQQQQQPGRHGPVPAARWARLEPLHKNAVPRGWPQLMLQLAASLLVIAIAVTYLVSFLQLPSSSSSSSSSSSPSAETQPPSTMKPSTGLLACAPFAAALNITWYRDEPLAPSPLPASHARSDGEAIVELFQNLGRGTVWKSVANVSFEGDTYEPEGMARLGDDRYVVSAGEYTQATQSYGDGQVINGTDRTAGAGFAHLIVFDGRGRRIADATLTQRGAIEYHNGGIDYDGRHIWGTIAQYRPNSSAYPYRADPATLKPTQILRYDDHLGGVVHDTQLDRITCLNWGSRNASTWDLGRIDKPEGWSSPKPRTVRRNPSYFVDYQDCKWLGHSGFYGGRSVMLCSGVATIGTYNLGGIALVDVETMEPLAEVPIAMESALGVRVTQNPVDASVVDGKLRLYWLPDQHNSTLYVYEAQPDSPFEFGGGPD